MKMDGGSRRRIWRSRMRRRMRLWRQAGRARRAEMQIAIAGAVGRLGRALTAALAGEHEVVHIDGDVRDAAVCRAGVEGCDAVVHLRAHPEGWPEGLDEGELLDTCARGT